MASNRCANNEARSAESAAASISAPIEEKLIL